MNKTIKILALAFSILVCISFSAIALIGMLCYYREAMALPWAIGAAVTFMTAFCLCVKLGEIIIDE